ncbi:MAG: sulfotransferase [Halioglobus sp.]|nr:sulfotransferase [Halioglobus sp.]
MNTQFIIIGAPRTGSTLLVRTLNSIAGLCCHGELLATQVRGYQDGFDPAQASKDERDWRLRRLREARDLDPAHFILSALDRDKVTTGFKALYSALLDVRWHTVQDALKTQKTLKIIHLTRRNSLRRYVSEQIMQSGGANHSAAGGKSDINIKVTIDIAAYQQATSALQAQGDQLLNLFRNHPLLAVTYEQLAEDTSATVSSVCRFLDVDNFPDKIVPALSKVGAADLKESVSNYQELLDHPSTRTLLHED